jgi:antitoxin ParD1/3/4
MAIQIPSDVEATIRAKVESGQYQDETDVLRTAMRLLEARDERISDVRALIAVGLESLGRGEGVELTPELMNEIDREADEMIAHGLQPNPDVCP